MIAHFKQSLHFGPNMPAVLNFIHILILPHYDHHIIYIILTAYIYIYIYIYGVFILIMHAEEKDSVHVCHNK